MIRKPEDLPVHKVIELPVVREGSNVAFEDKKRPSPSSLLELGDFFCSLQRANLKSDFEGAGIGISLEGMILLAIVLSFQNAFVWNPFSGGYVKRESSSMKPCITFYNGCPTKAFGHDTQGRSTFVGEHSEITK